MIELFIEGGSLFMGTLTLIGLAMISWSVFVGIAGSDNSLEESRHKLSHIKSIGVFALVTGVLGQLIGLYQGFVAIEQMGTVPPAMLAGGLKVSSITTLYGIIIFLISYVIWFALDYRLTAKRTGSN